MSWRNTREELPEEDKLILARFESHDSDEMDYWACKRDGKNLCMSGCCCFAVSRDFETYWVYISEIEEKILNDQLKTDGLKGLAAREAQQ